MPKIVRFEMVLIPVFVHTHISFLFTIIRNKFWKRNYNFRLILEKKTYVPWISSVDAPEIVVPDCKIKSTCELSKMVLLSA